VRREDWRRRQLTVEKERPFGTTPEKVSERLQTEIAALSVFALANGYPTICLLSFRPRSFRPGYFVPRSFRTQSFRPLVISSPAPWFPERGHVTLGNFEGYEHLKQFLGIKVPEND
jgi:hypothetical protein